MRFRLAVITFVIVFLPSIADAAWYNSSWLYRKTITIDADQVATTTNSGTTFPVLIDLTDANLATNAQSDGDDILFTSSDGSTKLDHEIEKYTNTSGTLTASVATAVSSTTDTTLYMYYGNSAATNQQAATSVWDSTYAGVWHMGNAASTTDGFTDSTSNANHGDGVGGPSLASTTAKVDGGYSFDGVDDYIQIPHHISLNPGTGDLTISAWFHTNSATFQNIVSKLGSSGYAVDILAASQRIRARFDDGPTSVTSTNDGADIIDGGWHHVIVVFDRDANMTRYVDGSQYGTADSIAAASGDVNNTAVANISTTGSGVFTGILDEIRVSNVARSAGWITTEYRNQSATTTFYTVGSQESESIASSNSSRSRDTTPPTASATSITLNAGIFSTILTATTNEQALCKYGTTPNRDYYEMTTFFKNTLGTTHTTPVTLFTTTTYYIRCMDDYGNTTPLDTTATITLSPPPTLATSTLATSSPDTATTTPSTGSGQAVLTASLTSAERTYFLTVLDEILRMLIAMLENFGRLPGG